MYIIFISYVGMFPHTGCYWEVKVLEDSEFNMKARSKICLLDPLDPFERPVGGGWLSLPLARFQTSFSLFILVS